VIVALSVCPRFDEGLSGYGRNKALHTLHLHRCGARFWASAAACVVHWPHAPSRAPPEIRHSSRPSRRALHSLGPAETDACLHAQASKASRARTPRVAPPPRPRAPRAA
jgi:hypothetical protein